MTPPDILKDNRILCIIGPQGSGKSILAREIAEQRGTYIVINEYHLLRPLLSFLDGRNNPANTVIVEEFTGRRDVVDRLKMMASEDQIVVNRKYKNPLTIPTPNFIVLSQVAFNLGCRFDAVYLGQSNEFSLEELSDETAKLPSA